MSANIWCIVNGSSKQPNKEDSKEYLDWILKTEEAAGIILKSLELSQYVHVEDKMDNPVAMWSSLKAAHQSQVANSCFFAMQKLLSSQKEDTEALAEYASRINTAVSELKALIPSVLEPTKTIGVWNVHAITKSLTMMSRIRRGIKPLLQHNSGNNLIFVPWLQSIEAVYVDGSQESNTFFSSKEWMTQLRSVWYTGSEFKYSKS